MSVVQDALRSYTDAGAQSPNGPKLSACEMRPSLYGRCREHTCDIANSVAAAHGQALRVLSCGGVNVKAVNLGDAAWAATTPGDR
jgi:hypothetical protein